MIAEPQKANAKSPNDVIDWNEFDFILNATRLFFLKLETSNMKFKKNDWIDLFSLGYVMSERNYFTFDKKGVNGVVLRNSELKKKLILGY